MRSQYARAPRARRKNWGFARARRKIWGFANARAAISRQEWHQARTPGPRPTWTCDMNEEATLRAMEGPPLDDSIDILIDGPAERWATEGPAGVGRSVDEQA